jgi:hypothetical protein
MRGYAATATLAAVIVGAAVAPPPTMATAGHPRIQTSAFRFQGDSLDRPAYVGVIVRTRGPYTTKPGSWPMLKSVQVKWACPQLSWDGLEVVKVVRGNARRSFPLDVPADRFEARSLRGDFRGKLFYRKADGRLVLRGTLNRCGQARPTLSYVAPVMRLGAGFGPTPMEYGSQLIDLARGRITICPED